MSLRYQRATTGKNDSLQRRGSSGLTLYKRLLKVYDRENLRTPWPFPIYSVPYFSRAVSLSEGVTAGRQTPLHYVNPVASVPRDTQDAQRTQFRDCKNQKELNQGGRYAENWREFRFLYDSGASSSRQIYKKVVFVPDPVFRSSSSALAYWYTIDR